MSRFATDKINSLKPYVAGEQPRDRKYIKLNTNENPYYTSKFSVDNVADSGILQNLNRYSDPECSKLTEAIASYYGVKPENVLVTNGSDEALAFTFAAYCTAGVCFPDVTYGFYEVIARLLDCPIQRVRLDGQFKIVPEKFYNAGKTVVIANPNAQTGIEMNSESLERIIINNPDNIVVVDQAYADFGNYNAAELIKKYGNLVVVNTFSKSRSLAGARVGYIIADRQLIVDLKKIKNSFHPYNVNSVSAMLAETALADDEYFNNCIELIKESRKKLSDGLREIGFCVLPSSANFVLAKYDLINGERLYELYKENGVLVRHLKDERIKNYVRITVGTSEEMEAFLEITKKIIAEN